MLLIGFPFKSPNNEKKVISDLPDLAERKSLEFLQQMLTAINTIYKPGANLVIFCDGIPFAQFIGISFNQVLNYEKALLALTNDLPSLKIYTSNKYLSKHNLKNPEEFNILLDKYAPRVLDFKANLDPQVLRTISERLSLEFDYQKGKELLEQESLSDRAFKLLAREAKLRTYISEQFPAQEYIRLTVHFSNDIGKKFGIKLSPDSCITPYHGVLVQENDDSWSIKFRKDVDLNRYQLNSMNINGINCAYFKFIN